MIIPKFPDFYALNLQDKNEYDELIAEYPPFSDILFATLHIWWNLEGRLGLSGLNGNLVLRYSLPFDPQNSGYSLVGKQSIDQSIVEIFAYLKKEHQDQKLVHVPEFVLDQIKNKDNLTISEEPDYHEYIMDSHQLASLEGHDHSRTRRKVTRFLRELGDQKVELKKLDLNDPEVKKMLYDSIEQWQPERLTTNDPKALGMQAVKRTLDHSHHLETQNLAVFIDSQLKGIALYHLSPDKNHYVVSHLKVDYSYPHIFDYLTKAVAEEAVANHVAFLNMEMDLGIEGLRRHKMGLRPVNFFKKYRLEPVQKT